MEALTCLYLLYMKQSGTRHRLMAALMISSQLLLTAFMMYWLVGQYREERTVLYGQLKKEYFLVQDQLLDSMLMEHLVMPSLDDSVMVMKQVFKDSPFDSDSLTIHLNGMALPDSGTRTFDISTSFSAEERMVRSVKLFINKNPMAFHSNSGVHVFATNLDTTSLFLNLEQALQEKNWPFVLTWTGEDPDRAEESKNSGIILGGGPDSALPKLRVNHTAAYLIRSILPQILFGLILLLLSGSALLFAYRSLLRQLALNKLRNDFVGNISHELKTPVSTVKVALEALRSYDKQKDPVKADEYLEMANRELARLESLVGKVLHHEILDNPSLVLDKEPCDPGELARSAIRTLEIPIRKTGARVALTEEGRPCRVQVDRVYVEGMIINLIDNSLKYSGEHPEIAVHIACNPSATTLSVTDKGPGIPEEYKDQVFEKFFRIPAGNTHNVKGYGLGLNFAAQVMAKHGGNISYSKPPDGGCRFTLEFPRTVS